MKTREWLAVSAMFILLALTAIFPVGFPKQQKANAQTQQGQDARRQAQIEKAKRLSSSVRKIGKMLKDANVPFDSSILFSRIWRKKVDAYRGRVPELTQIRQAGGKLEGVQLADTLVLPENVELSGDALIITRQLIFGGRHVVIKGNHDLHIFLSEPILSTNDAVQTLSSTNGVRFERVGFSSAKSVELAKRQGLLVAPESVSISVDGYGREQWLEDQKNKKGQNKIPGLRAAHVRGVAIPQQNADGADKTGEGPKGDDGTDGVTPVQAAIGADGDCATNPDGGTGETGHIPQKAGTGHTGGWGDDAEDGHTLSFRIESGMSNVALSAKGGQGQKGGLGGYGGTAARGGQGGPGAPGKVCNCPGRSGNGGRGGTGGRGGQGGDGGPGGTGGNGGSGGTINLTKPCDFTNYTTNVNAGLRGPAGDPGHYRPGGQGGPGGTPAINAECGMQGGTSLGIGPDGDSGPPGDRDGDPGTPGEPGDHAGQVNTSDYGNCGGGGDDPTLEPGGSDGGCTEWWWVQYSCTQEIGDSRSRQRFLEAVYRPDLAQPLPEWSCSETGRWYAGCW